MEIRRRTDPRTQIVAYQRLIRQVAVFASWRVLPWDDDATLLTRNLADFKPVPGLRVENWLD